MSLPNRRHVITAGAAGAALIIATSQLAHGEKKPEASKLLDAMEGFRKTIPPAQGIGEENGQTFDGLGGYLNSHLSGVARRLGVKTRIECLMLLTYLKDGDLRLRFIAIEAINQATNAYPHGWSVECVTNTNSEGHRKMLFRFLEVIDKMKS